MFEDWILNALKSSEEKSNIQDILKQKDEEIKSLRSIICKISNIVNL